MVARRVPQRLSRQTFMATCKRALRSICESSSSYLSSHYLVMVIIVAIFVGPISQPLLISSGGFYLNTLLPLYLFKSLSLLWELLLLSTVFFKPRLHLFFKPSKGSISQNL